MSKITQLDTYKSSPFAQAAAVTAVAVLAMLFVKGFQGEDLQGRNWETIWMIVVMFLLFFAMLNSVICLSAPNQNKYFGQSVVSFAAVGILLSLVAYGVSGVSYGNTDFFKWMLMVVGFGYLVFMSIVMAMYRIVQYAKKQDKNLRNEK